MRASRNLLLEIIAQGVSGASVVVISLFMGAPMLPHPVDAPNGAAQLTDERNIDAAPAFDAAPTVTPSPLGALLVDLRSNAGLASSTTPSESQHIAQTRVVTQSFQFGDNAPLPPRRPAEFGLAASYGSLQVPQRHAPRQNMQTALAAPPSENRSFVEKIFGPSHVSGPALGYAAPETSVVEIARSMTSSPSLRYDRWTAVYDISAHTVYLPDGSRLEAHSGLGARLDDPRFVHERMHGPTPPNVYELTPREQLFHGVQALRLTPVGGGTFGRVGLLAHTYMLGPKGDSNGCVSFKNYGAFLQAYQNGQIKRLVVVSNLN